MKGKTFLLVSPVVSFRLKKQTSRNVRASEIKEKTFFLVSRLLLSGLKNQLVDKPLKEFHFSVKADTVRQPKTGLKW